MTAEESSLEIEPASEASREPAFWSVIPAGGAGTRLWPLSRSNRPKFLLDLLGKRSLLQQTVDRLAPFSTPDRILIVAGSAHIPEIARQLPEIPAENIIVEPAPRGTAPAIALAALLIRRRDPGAIMGSFAADHVVENQQAFRDAVSTAIAAARSGWLTTIGLTPTRPETGYGYIERTGDEVVESVTGTAYQAAGFTEKPDLARAERFVADGRFLWNASMFIWQVQVMVDELSRVQPGLLADLEQISEHWGETDGEEFLARHWLNFDQLTIDHGLMEKSDHVAVVPAEMGWSDVGDWHGLGELLATDHSGNSVTGKCLQIDTEQCVAWSTTGRMIAMLGLRNLAIIDTPDALLVLDRDRAQDVRKIVERLDGTLESLR